MQVNAIIKATATNGKAINTTVSYLRQSQEDKAATFGAALNALTTNTLDSVQVNEINVTPEAGKQEPTLTVTKEKRAGATFDMTVTYNGVAQGIDGIAMYKVNKGSILINVLGSVVNLTAETGLTDFNDAIFTVYVPETENYTAKTVEYSDWTY